jgi:hypothetical protein
MKIQEPIPSSSFTSASVPCLMYCIPIDVSCIGLKHVPELIDNSGGLKGLSHEIDFKNVDEN